MIGHAEYAQRTKKPEDMEEAVEIVERTSDRVSKIIQDLSTFSKREPAEKKPCSITELVEFMLSMTEEQLKKHNIKVVREYEKIPNLEVNKGEMQQVFLNMVTNARDAMLPNGGRLTIKVKKVKESVEVSFSDTGIGIEEENLGRVFEPFFTTKGAAGGDARIQGIGLGLSVSFGIVRRHDGSIEVESEIGKGTTFTVRIPVKAIEARKTRAKAARKTKKRKLDPQSILVVDDEKAICQMFRKWLSSEGHKVKSELTGRKAINLVRREWFDIVFLDIVMPGISGVKVLERIKEISPKTKVIMITGSLLKENTWHELKQKGASGFIMKPFSMEDIDKCITDIQN
jgi:CheY-like chemotaxis protein